MHACEQQVSLTAFTACSPCIWLLAPPGTEDSNCLSSPLQYVLPSKFNGSLPAYPSLTRPFCRAWCTLFTLTQTSGSLTFAARAGCLPSGQRHRQWAVVVHPVMLASWVHVHFAGVGADVVTTAEGHWRRFVPGSRAPLLGLCASLHAAS